MYGPNTRLKDLENDEEVMELLAKENPIAYGIIVSKDKENSNLTLGELPWLAFYGFDASVVLPVNEKIYNIKRW